MLFSCCNLLWFLILPRGQEGIKLLCLLTPRPGAKPTEERRETVAYLEEVAVDVAKVIANKTVYFYLTPLCPNSLSPPLKAVLFDQLLCTHLCNIYVEETQEDNLLSRGHYVFYLFRVLLFISSSLFLQWPCSNMIT